MGMGKKEDRRNMERWEKVLGNDRRPSRKHQEKRRRDTRIYRRRREERNNDIYSRIHGSMEGKCIPEIQKNGLYILVRKQRKSRNRYKLMKICINIPINIKIRLYFLNFG